MGVRGEIFSNRIILPNRTYFFNVKENRMGDLYLNIVESKNRETGGFDRQSVILFADDLQEFLKGFDEALKILEKSTREKRRSGKVTAKHDEGSKFSSGGKDKGFKGNRDGERNSDRSSERSGERNGDRNSGGRNIDRGSGRSYERSERFQGRGSERGERNRMSDRSGGYGVKSGARSSPGRGTERGERNRGSENGYNRGDRSRNSDRGFDRKPEKGKRIVVRKRG